jgi:predicted dehydrogenase
LQISTLVIGLGNIGMGYDLARSESKSKLSHAGAVNSSRNFKLAAGVDSDSNVRKIFEKNFTSRSFANISDALTSTSPELAIISTPTQVRLSLVEELLGSKTLRVILIEKPLAKNVEEASKIIRLCQENGTKLFVNYMRNSSQGTLNFKEWLDKQDISGSFSGNIWYQGGLLNNGSHFVNLLEFLLGPADKFVRFNPRDFDDSDPDNPHGILLFPNGSVSVTPIECGGAKVNGFRIFFKDFSFELSREIGGFTVRNCINDTIFKNNSMLETMAQEFPIEIGELQTDVLNQINNYLSGKKFAVCSGERALQTISVLNPII